jgi:hypothetical protein
MVFVLFGHPASAAKSYTDYMIFIEVGLNQRRRTRMGFKTPYEVFHASLNMLRIELETANHILKKYIRNL